MSEADVTPSIDVGDIVDRARSHWAYACTRAPDSCIELYAKVAQRSRVERTSVRDQTSHRVAVESGMAARVWRQRASTAGFAAAAGFSRAATITVVMRARSDGWLVTSDSPEFGPSVDAERWDIDETEPPVSRGTVDSVFEQAPFVDALELGTTVEVLVGPGGWVAARQRRRVWVSRAGPGPKLAAKRGFKDWAALLRTPEVDDPPVLEHSGCHSLVLGPQAAAPIVSALTSKYLVTAEPTQMRGGPGWSLSDDPHRADGLAGGAFDDAGFPSRLRELAMEGTPIGSIWGPGTLWRRSFRSPPTPGASNLSMPGKPTVPSSSMTIRASSSRLLPLESDVWVLALDLGRTKGYVRLTPHEWMARISGMVGEEEVTSDGPILRAVMLEHLPVNLAG